MNNRNAEKSSMPMNKSCQNANLIRSEESLAKAASVLKSLSNWGKNK